MLTLEELNWLINFLYKHSSWTEAEMVDNIIAKLNKQSAPPDGKHYQGVANHITLVNNRGMTFTLNGDWSVCDA